MLRFRYKWDNKKCELPIYAIKDHNAKCERHYDNEVEYIILSKKFEDIRSVIKSFETKLINYKMATAIITGMAAYLGEDINKCKRNLIDNHLKVIYFIFFY